MSQEEFCAKCNNPVDEYEGDKSEKWFPGSILCNDCWDAEAKEIQNDEEIDYLESEILDAEQTIRESHKKLKELKDYVSPIFISIE